jgi:hypothetical protein
MGTHRFDAFLPRGAPFQWLTPNDSGREVAPSGFFCTPPAEKRVENFSFFSWLCRLYGEVAAVAAEGESKMIKETDRNASVDFGAVRDLTAEELASVCGGQQYPPGYPDGLPMPVPHG